jgi:hypothetical protein
MDCKSPRLWYDYRFTPLAVIRRNLIFCSSVSALSGKYLKISHPGRITGWSNLKGYAVVSFLTCYISCLTFRQFFSQNILTKGMCRERLYAVLLPKWLDPWRAIVNTVVTDRFPWNQGMPWLAEELHFKECHPRCVGKLDRWEGSQKHKSYDI